MKHSNLQIVLLHASIPKEIVTAKFCSDFVHLEKTISALGHCYTVLASIAIALLDKALFLPSFKGLTNKITERREISLIL